MHTAVNIPSLTIDKGRIMALVGESGSGKSLTALSILQLLPPQAVYSGNIFFHESTEKKIDLTKLSQGAIATVRGYKISMIFQEPMTSLNPVITCGKQVMESLVKHKKLSEEAARLQTIKLFRLVELPDPAGMVSRYPHQLSGGQKQRVMIAMAMSCNPPLLIADEPTTALDVSVQKNILGLIKNLQSQYELAVLLITHDLGLVADIADDIAVMYKGEIVEQGHVKTVLKTPAHSYTKALLACRPAQHPKGKKLPVLSDFLEEEKKIIGTDILDTKVRSTITDSTLKNKQPDISPVLSVQNLVVQFPEKKNVFGKTTSFYKAVDDVSFDVMKNETIGLVGESGCGKTTLARTILHLVNPTSGKIILNGKDIAQLNRKQLSAERKELQIVFQDPYGSLNPRLSIGEAIMEPMMVHQLYKNNKQRKEKIVSLLKQVQLEEDHFNRYPHQFSGGQRQRICIARALALEPSFLVFDEIVSALDVSVQAQVLNLINELKITYGFTSIFISHDLAVVHYISDRIMVMQKGKIIESGSADQVYHHPVNAYTKKLVDAIPGKQLANSI